MDCIEDHAFILFRILMTEIDAKAKKIMNKYYSGTKIVITDLDYIFKNL